MEKIIIAQLSVKQNKIENFKDLAKRLVEKTRQEPGCLAYRLLNDVDNANEFVIYEKYVNQEAVDVHSSSEHLKAFLTDVTELLDNKPSIDLYSSE